MKLMPNSLINKAIFTLQILQRNMATRLWEKKGHTDVSGVRFQKPLIKSSSERYDILRAIGKTWGNEMFLLSQFIASLTGYPCAHSLAGETFHHINAFRIPLLHFTRICLLLHASRPGSEVGGWVEIWQECKLASINSSLNSALLYNLV